MKKISKRNGCVVAITILLLASSFSAGAQYSSKIITANAWASAVAKDASGNIYVLEAITHASTNVDAQVLKYTNGTGTPAVIYSGNLIHDIYTDGYLDDYAFGLAVTSNGDVYATTTNQYNGSVNFYGNIIKLTNNSGTYTGSVFKTGNANNGAFASLAVDASDNLYCVEYNVAGNGGAVTNGVPGSYEVVKYPATAGVPSTVGATVLYDKLELLAFASSSVYSAITGLTVDAAGNIYVGDSFNNSTLPSPDGGHVYKLTKSGSTYTPSTFSTNTFATALAMDASGNLYALTGNSNNANYTLVEYVGATGAPVTLLSGVYTASGSWYPFGLAVLNNNNIFTTNGAQLGDLIQVTGPPTTQATNVNFTNINAAGTGATVNWTNGNGSARAVFIKQVTTGNPTAVNNTTYTANVNFTSGSQIGATGWYCIYNGTGATVNITGLTSGQTYRVMVMEYNGAAGLENYLQTTATNNPNNVSPLALTTISSINRVSAAVSNAASVNYTVTFAVSVTALTTSNFSLSTTGTLSGTGIASLSGSGATYTVVVNTGSGNGDITLNLANATNLVPGLSTTLPFAGQAYTIDKIAPTVTISSPSATLTRSGPITYTVTYADANFNSSTLATGNITLNKTGTANGALAVTGTGLIRTVTISSITGDGTLGITLAAATASDLGGNTAPAAGPSATFTVDNTRPTVVISSTAPDPTGTSPIPIKLTFSENVTGFTQANVSLNQGSIANFSGSGSVYNFNIATAGYTTYTVNIAATQITDLAGNTNTLAASFSITYTSPLAVQLLSFDAAEKNGAVALNWKIAAEQNNDHYLLERSTDGNVFNTLGVVQAQFGGNSSSEVDYSYIDNNPVTGNDFYRLTQVDKDARAKQLGIRVVRVGKATADWTVYPNPVSKAFSISLPFGADGKKTISIFDAAGKLVYRAAVQSNAGRLAVTLDKPLARGMYTVQVEGLGARVIFFE